MLPVDHPISEQGIAATAVKKAAATVIDWKCMVCSVFLRIKKLFNELELERIRISAVTDENMGKSSHKARC